MAPKAPPPSPQPAASEFDLKYIMACIKHNSTKLTPDFDEVAKETGKKDRTAARLALNVILRKWGISQGQKSTVEGVATSPATPKSKKRTRVEKKGDGGGEVADAVEDDADQTPSKKMKVGKDDEEDSAGVGEN